MNKMLISALLVFPLIYISTAEAGCAENQTACFVITATDSKQVGCHVTVCANVHSYQSIWTLDGGTNVAIEANEKSSLVKIENDKAIQLPDEILKEGLTCVSKSDTDMTICAKDIPE